MPTDLESPIFAQYIESLVIKIILAVVPLSSIIEDPINSIIFFGANLANSLKSKICLLKCFF